MIPPRSPNELDVLKELMNGPQTVRQLRHTFDCSTGTIHNRLIELRFKSPEPQIEGTKDGKSYVWTITPAGRQRVGTS